MDASVIELFEAAGYLDVDAFRANSVEQMHAELERANTMLNLVDELPTVEEIESWRKQIAGGSESDPNDVVEALVVPQEVTSVESEELIDKEDAEIPFAQPLSRKFIAKHHILVDDLPELGETVSSMKVVQKAELPQQKKALVEKLSPTAGADLEKQKLRSIDDARGEKVHVSALPTKNGKVDRTKVVSPEVNEGVDPHSRKYIRGVLHNDPIGTSFGAYAFVLTILLAISSLLPLLYIIFNREEYMWGLLSPALFGVAMLLYIGSARKTSCPVCRQRQFSPKSCLKHNKAHHVRGVGYMLPTAVHLIYYKWFRCIFCGTSIRVKE